MRRALLLILLASPAHAMNGALGSYPMTRDASGTAWGPEAAPHEGLHYHKGEWMLMVHGYANAIYDKQTGPRGSEMGFSESMLMAMAGRDAGPGRLNLRSMLSLEPAMGKRGYPLLGQAGETADGHEVLVDRQHPHDLFMELAASYSLPIGDEASAFVYAGLPGEPALGPAAFMHRFSGADNPEAPLSHHWLDSTHIVFGVLTAGYVWKNVKLEMSGFRGREPDQHRWDIETGGLDSFSTRATYNPTPNWSAQVSYGAIHSPEGLHPDEDVDRVTASASYHDKVLDDGEWQTTGAWGRNKEGHGDAENAYLLESALVLEKKHTFFGRLEGLQRHDLFHHGDPKHGQRFFIGKLSVGYIRDFPWKSSRFGVGGAAGVLLLPNSLREDYGDRPVSLMLFLRAKLG